MKFTRRTTKLLALLLLMQNHKDTHSGMCCRKWSEITGEEPNLCQPRPISSRLTISITTLVQTKKNKCLNQCYHWRSIISARDLLERGARKRVGDGPTIDIWRDRWILDRGKGKVSTPKPSNCQLQNVHELIQNEKWNVDKIKGSLQ